MANSRIEERPSTETRSVRVVDCDNCGKPGVCDSLDDNAARAWLRVSRDRRLDGVLCSMDCLAMWAVSRLIPAAAETSESLTAVARDAFRKTAGR